MANNTNTQNQTKIATFEVGKTYREECHTRTWLCTKVNDATGYVSFEEISTSAHTVIISRRMKHSSFNGKEANYIDFCIYSGGQCHRIMADDVVEAEPVAEQTETVEEINVTTEETKADLEYVKTTQPVAQFFQTKHGLYEEFSKHNADLVKKGLDPRDYKNAIVGVVVFSNASDWVRHDFPVTSRAYRISSNNKAFISGMCGYSIFGLTLDGTDNARLEREKWIVNFAYLEKAKEVQ